MKLKNKWPLLFLLLPVMFFLTEILFFAGGVKRIYYQGTYNPNNVKVAVCDNFKFFENGYACSLNLNSKYYTAHRILLIPDSNKVPIDFEFKGKMKFECYSNGTLLHSFTSEKAINIFQRERGVYCGNYMMYCGVQKYQAKSIFAFEVGEIPFELFCLKWNRLKDMQIKVDVLEADEQLKSFCDKAELVVIPNLFL